MVEQHLLRGGEDGLGLLGGARVQLMFGDEAQLLHKVLLPDALLNQLLKLLSAGRGRGQAGGEGQAVGTEVRGQGSGRCWGLFNIDVRGKWDLLGRFSQHEYFFVYTCVST